MPVYTIQGPSGRRYRVEAATQDDAVRGVQEQEQPRARNPVQAVTGFMANVNRGIGIGDEVAAGMQTGLNVLTGHTPLSQLVQDFRRSMARQRLLEQSVGPHAQALGRGVGMAATAAVPAGEAASALQTGGRLVAAARGAVTGGTTAAIYSAADAGTPLERLHAAATAARDPAVLALGAAGGALAARGSPGQRANVRPAVRTLNEAGVQLTPGQISGGVGRAVEDAATSLPIVGTAIRKARDHGNVTFTNAVLNRALHPTGETVPEGMTGRDAVRFAGDRLSAAYDGLVPEIGVSFDNDLAAGVSQMQPIVETMTPESLDRLRRVIDNRVVSRVPEDGVVDGSTFQRIVSELRYESRRFSRSGDPDHQSTAEAIDTMTHALEDAASRQNPQYGQRLQALDQGYAYLVRAENAAARAGADEGFTPTQFDSAVRAGDARTRSRGFARGEALGQDLATAGRQVMPATINNSGTADRVAIGSAVAGGVAGLPGVIGSSGALWLASKAYGPRAMELVNQALSNRIAAEDRAAAAAELSQIARQNPESQRVLGPVLQRLGQVSAMGAATSARQSQDQAAQ